MVSLASSPGFATIFAALAGSTIVAYGCMKVITPRGRSCYRHCAYLSWIDTVRNSIVLAVNTPRTESPEWKEAELEYRIAQNQNPIFGYVSKAGKQ